MSGFASARRIPPAFESPRPFARFGRRRPRPCARIRPAPTPAFAVAGSQGKPPHGRLAPRPRFRIMPASPKCPPAASASPPAMAMSRRERIGGAIANAGAEQGGEQVRRSETGICQCAPRPLNLSNRGMGLHVSGEKQKDEARHGMTAIAWHICTILAKPRNCCTFKYHRRASPIVFMD